MALSVSRLLIGVSGNIPTTTVVFAHATGFCAGVWRPIIKSLREAAARAKTTAEIIAFDFSGHGKSRARPAVAREWADFGTRDVLQALNASKAPAGRKLVGVGHSMGAAALVLTQIRKPVFDSIVAFEPIIFPFDKPESPPDIATANPLSAGASRRKRAWASVVEAKAYFRSKPTFQNWHPDALKGFLECGLAQEGGSDAALQPSLKTPPPPSPSSESAPGVRLACDPAFEAEIYTGYHDAFEHLPEVQCPVSVVGGAQTGVFPALGNTAETFRKIAERLPHGTLEMVNGTGHFVVMEKPMESAAIITRAIGW